MSYQVFISHSSKDKVIADGVREALEASGLKCWIAPRDIIPGEDWSEAIMKGLTECSVTALIFSESAAASVQVRREVERSFEKGKGVVPFKIDDVMPSGAFEYYLSSVHWLTASAPIENFYPTLVETVKRLLPSDVSAPTNASPASPSSAPVPSTPPARPKYDNLPAPPAPYVGRERELIEWEKLLADSPERLLTLVGFGGMGKTRTALEIGSRCIDRFADGVCWTELDVATSPDEMIRQIVSSLNLNLQPQPSALDQLVAYLKEREMLLILDNAEQIEEAGRVLNDLLRALPKIKWLVTSRKALELATERVIEVPPLAQEEAEALFVERATSRNPTFERTEENAEDIAELCRRLEGMPLAIELAAARIVGMTPRDMLKRLDDQFKLLQTRSSHLPPRQRAMHGAIEWSHNLLNDEDRSLFAQLSVFSNGFTLENAEAICDAFDVMEGVLELRKHSLLRSETHAESQRMRFFMLELVRAYASEKLDGAEIRRKHADYFLDFAKERNRRLRTKDEAKALEELTVELDNLRSAFRWSLDESDGALSVELSLAISRALYYRGFWKELKETLHSALAVSESLTDEKLLLKAELIRQIASLEQDLGDPKSARDQAEKALSLFEEKHHPEGVAESLNLLGLIATDDGDLDSARAYFERSLETYGDANPRGRAMARHNLARLASRRGDIEDAQRLYEESLTDRRKAGDARGEAETLGNLGALAYNAGEYVSARSYYRQSLSIRDLLKDRFGIALMLYNLGELAEIDGDDSRSVAYYLHSERIFNAYPSAYASAPAESLKRLSETWGDERFDFAREDAFRRPLSEILKSALETETGE